MGVLAFDPPSSIIACIFVLFIILSKYLYPSSSAFDYRKDVPPLLEFMDIAPGEFGCLTTLYNLGFIDITNKLLNYNLFINF